MHHIMYSLVLILVVNFAISQTFLEGVVVEENAKGILAPLIGANVYWSGTVTGTTTDTVGIFKIPDDHNNHQLVISYIGYQSDTIQIEDHDKLTIVLKSTVDLNEVEVIFREKATKIDFRSSINKQIMGEKELFKAACCNLSESFETNPSIDVSFTDAVTGTRQIEMLGLAGIYTQLTQGNMPYVRGLASSLGLTYVPGAWVESIQVTKGIGPVINGYESMAGQINVELKKPEGEEKLLVNTYINQSGRSELNLHKTFKLNKNLSTSLLGHGAVRPLKTDGNNDGFMDVPQMQILNLTNRWKFDNQKGLMGQFGIKALLDDKVGGQMAFDKSLNRDSTNPYGVGINTKRVEGWYKTGYVFSEKRYKSMGIQLYALNHQQNSFFGLRNYEAKQETYYANFIYQSIIGNTNHQFKTGLSFLSDHYDEVFEVNYFRRLEQSSGAFFEYTYDYHEKFNLIAGMRVDYNNLFKWVITPRLHLRYAVSEKTVLRASVGRGQRTANIFAENMSLLASSRSFEITSSNDKSAYGLNPEKSWNGGISLSQDFRLNYKEGVLVVDFYRTEFIDQVIIDRDNDPQKVLFYNLSGRSYSNSFQTTIDYEIMHRFDLRLAYRWYDVQTDYLEGRLSKALVANHRGFVNLAYETKNKWFFDYTFNVIGPKRLPGTESNTIPYQLETNSPSFVTMNTQVSKSWTKKWRAYIGVENLTNFKQNNPILSSEQPFGRYFDSSLVWGPIFGRMIYLGASFTI